jgi:hypothetical protein
MHQRKAFVAVEARAGWLLVGLLLAGCGATSSSDSSSGGKPSHEGSAGSGSGASFNDCAKFSPCGGELAGRWRLRASCIGSSYNDPACKGYASNQSVSGVAIFDFGSEGTIEYEGAASFTYDISVSDGCAQAIAHKDAAGYCKLVQDSDDDDPTVPTSISCDASTGPCQCHVAQGPIASGADGAYTASGSTVTMEQGGNLDTLSYCVKGDTLTLGSLDGLPSTVFSRE